MVLLGKFQFYSEVHGKRKLRVQTLNGAICKTERDVPKAVEDQLAALNADTLAGKVEVTFGQVVERYMWEELPNCATALR